MPPAKPKRRKLFDPLRLHLPASCGLDGIDVFAELGAELEALSRPGAQLNSRLAARREEIIKRLKNGAGLEGVLESAADLRVVLALWQENGEFLRRAPLDKHFTARLSEFLPAPSRLFLWQLTQLYLVYYDKLPAYRELAAWLDKAFAVLPSRSGETQEIKAYRAQRRGLFGKDGPAALLKYCKRKQTPLHAAAQDWALPEAARFSVTARRRYYLEPLPAAADDAPLFEELRLPEVKESVMEDGLLLGHHACRTLMDAALESGEDLAEARLRFLLDLMGDPRVPRSAPQYQQWWGRLEKKYLDAVRVWLSRLDLKLFLNILEEVARNRDHKDLLRMYPARKRFLEGLQEQGLIKQARLLLGRQAEKYIREHFDAHELPEFATLGAGDISLIYLNLGNAHLLEGTHTFQARLYHILPIPGLADYEADSFNLSVLRKYPADDTIRHRPVQAPRWQHDLIETLALPPFNLQIEVRRVLSAQDYRKYVEVFV